MHLIVGPVFTQNLNRFHFDALLSISIFLQCLQIRISWNLRCGYQVNPAFSYQPARHCLKQVMEPEARANTRKCFRLLEAFVNLREDLPAANTNSPCLAATFLTSFSSAVKPLFIGTFANFSNSNFLADSNPLFSQTRLFCRYKAQGM